MCIWGYEEWKGSEEWEQVGSQFCKNKNYLYIFKKYPKGEKQQLIFNNGNLVSPDSIKVTCTFYNVMEKTYCAVSDK